MLIDLFYFFFPWKEKYKKPTCFEQSQIREEFNRVAQKY